MRQPVYISLANILALWFMCGSTVLLNVISGTATRMEKVRAGHRMRVKLTPEERSAVISLSSENRPNAISVATRTATGAASAIIHAVFRKRYSRIISMGSPLPRKRSTARRRKLVKSKKMTISRA